MTPIDLRQLPAINAGLNALSALLLTSAYFLVRIRRIRGHRACILSALATSSLFLALYLVYHVEMGHIPYGGTGWARIGYRVILGSHSLLAVLVPPLAATTLLLARREDGLRHRALGRWTFAIWLYVSVTGVAVYWMLKPFYPGA